MRIKKFRSAVAMILTLMILITWIPVSSVRAAAAASMSVSGTAEVGKTITVSIKVSGTDGPYSGFSGGFVYNSNLLTLTSISSNYSSYNWYSSISMGTFSCAGASIPTGSTIVSAKFTCKAAGDTTISLSDFEVDANYTSASRSISIKTPVPLSGNANLSSLKVSPGTLNPSFSSSRTSYSMDVAEDVSKVTVTAVAEHSKAKVTLNGVQNNIKPGVNTIKITVKAEDGTSKVYSVKVTRATGPTGSPTPTPQPLPLMEYLNQEWMIVPIDEDTDIPDGFSTSTATYKGVEIPVFKGPAQAGSTDQILLVQLLTDEQIRLFVYDQSRQSVYPLLFISQPETSLRVLDAADANQIPYGYEAFDFTHDGETVTAYRLISDPANPQILMLLMNAQAEEVFYLYDTLDQSFMPYRGKTVLVEPTPSPTPSVEPTDSQPSMSVSESSVPTESEAQTAETKSILQNLKDFRNPFTIIFYLVCLIAIALVAAVVALMISRRSDYDGDDYDQDDYDEDYLPEDEDLPPIASYEPGDFSEERYDPDDVFEERSEPVKYRGGQTPYIPSIARVRDSVDSAEIPLTPITEPVVATPPLPHKPVADATPVMGVRAINPDSLAQILAENSPPVSYGQADKQAGEHIPVRLKQELEAKKAQSEIGNKAKPSSGEHPGSGETAVPKLDFPEIRSSAPIPPVLNPEPEIQPDIDPDM